MRETESPPPSPHDSLDRGVLAVLFGALLTLFGAAQLVGFFLDEPITQMMLVLGATSLAAGPSLLVFGRRAVRRARAARQAYSDSLPEDDVIEGDDFLLALAEALGAEVLRAPERTLGDALMGNESRVASEHHDRVSFAREGIQLVAYECFIRGQWMQDDVGPGIYEARYVRVSAEMLSSVELHVFPRSAVASLEDAISVPMAGTGDRDFDARFAVRGSPRELERFLDVSARAVLMRFPTMIFRCHRGRVEALRPRDTSGPELCSRFEAAITLVVRAKRTLGGERASA